MIYLAAPLFNPVEREFNSRLKRLIKHPVYLPQEDGVLLADLVSKGVNSVEAISTVFEADISALNASDLLLAVLNGPHVDSGVAFEIGYIRSLGRPVIGFHTDVRSEIRLGFNPMISGALSDLVKSEEELVAAIDRWYPKKSNT